MNLAPIAAGICIQTTPGHGAPLSPAAGIAVLPPRCSAGCG